MDCSRLRCGRNCSREEREVNRNSRRELALASPVAGAPWRTGRPTVKCLRGRAILAVLLGCGLRRSEVAALTFAHVEQRDGRWCICGPTGEARSRSHHAGSDVGEGGDRRMDVRGRRRRWLRLPTGESRRRCCGRTAGEKVVWQMLREYADVEGVPGIAPRDLLRICAKLCRAAGGELEQIQLLLGHASVQTTERYVGTKQDLVHAPNDAIKLRVAV